MKTNFTYTRCPVFQPSSNDFNLCTYHDPADDERECGFCKRPEYYRCLADDKVIPLSYSSVSNFLTCHHLYYLTAIRGIQTKDSAQSSALKLGTLWDAVLQKHLGTLGTDPTINIPDIIKQYEMDPKDVAKVRGIYRAYKELGIQVESGYELQSKISLTLPFDKVWGDGYPVELLVTGFYDRKYPDYFVENKFSGRPSYYQDPFLLLSQIGTYFLADPSLKHVIMEIVQAPLLKQTGKTKDEDPEEFCERIFQDALSRPSFYFVGYNKETRAYGKKFFRSEFNLEELRDRYLHVFRELYDARLLNGFYKNSRACNNVLPSIPCEMLSVCRYNNLSESVYQIRERKG